MTTARIALRLGHAPLRRFIHLPAIQRPLLHRLPFVTNLGSLSSRGAGARLITTSRRPRQPTSRSLGIGLSVVGIGAAALLVWRRTTEENPVTPKEDRRVFTRAEVRKHNSAEKGIWVTHADGVYDITDFVDIHPGGEKILLAAGHSIDPFWAIFAIHNSPETHELLESYRIGDLMESKNDPTFNSTQDDTIAITKALEKLFENDPPRDPALIVRSARPCNAETPPNLLTNADSLLTESFITPNNLFFVRNHLPVPSTDYDFIEVDAPWIPTPVRVNLNDLKTKFEQKTVVTTLQCAGNRRKEMHDTKPVKGLLWTQGAIGNASWTGVPLINVIKSAIGEIPQEWSEKIQHVQFDGAEGYGASIPVYKALDPRGDCILAFEMNGEPLPRDHGWPLRAVVPGHVAARSVKWVTKISLSEDESESHWQQRDYKGFGPSKSLEQSDYSKSTAIQELPVQSCITVPQDGDGVRVDKENTVSVKGFAWSGGGRGIVRVDVSGDGGKTWVDGRLMKPEQPLGRVWAWTHWEANVPVSTDSQIEIVCKAVDASYNEQPERPASVYNVRGVLVSPWHRVKVRKVDEAEQEK